MSLFFFNIIQSIRDKYSWFQGDFYVVIKIIVGVSPCHHIVTGSNNTSYSLNVCTVNTVLIMETVPTMQTVPTIEAMATMLTVAKRQKQ